jgi:hypothetical protein
MTNILCKAAARRAVNISAVHTIGMHGRARKLRRYALVFGLAWISQIANAQAVAPVITSRLTASGVVGVDFQYQIEATNSPRKYGAATYVDGTWTIAPGISGSSSTGLIYGRPTVAGTFKINLAAYNGAGKGIAELVLTVAPAPASSETFAKPRTAVTYFGRNVESAIDRSLVARYQLAIIGQWAGLGEARLQANVQGIKSLNPNIKIAQYVMLQESRDMKSGDSGYSAWQSINANGWWLLTADGKRTQWTSEYATYLLNVTDWAPVDKDGNRWPQVKAKHDTDSLLSKMKGIDYVFIDGFGEAMADGDWKRIGTDQWRKDPEIASAFRKGQMGYVTTLRKLNPGLKVIGNTGTIGSTSAEYSGQLEGFYRECLMGKYWSLENVSWERMMDSYRKALANTKAPNLVVFGACFPSADPAAYRYGMASALLEDGYYSFSVNGYQSLPWFDESDAPLGMPAEAQPTAPTLSGIWTRKYTNGIVLVNPSKTTAASINLGAGYKHLNGAIDPVVNNGLPVSIVTLQPRQGLVLIRQ